MGSTDLLRDQLDRLIAAVEAGERVIPHNDQIRPEWRKDVFIWARQRLRLPFKRWRSYKPEAYSHHAWDGTQEPIDALYKALTGNFSCAVSSATGIGKTFAGAVLLLWFLDCWEGAQVVTMAPKKDQLTLHMWKEIGRMWPLFQKLHPQATLDTLRIRMRPGRDDWGAVGFPCGVGADEDVANKARGFHAEHLLFVIEETTGVDPAILAAVKFTCTAPHNLRVFFGNPDSEFDPLAMVSREPGVVAVRASALDHPNVVGDDPALIPGATSRQKIQDLREEYGEDNPLYKSRVRGIAPAQGATALVRFEWLEQSAARWAEGKADRRKGNAALGVDVANSPNGDKAALAFGRGQTLLELKAMPCPDANEFGRHHVWPMIESGLVGKNRVGVDNVGVGVGTVNELRRLGALVVGLNGGEHFWEEFTRDNEQFNNLRSQLWWQLRHDLQRGNVDLPNDRQLWDDILVVTWKTMNGKIVVESKEDLKKRLGRSPDKGDAVVYWNWMRQFTRGLDISDTLARVVSF
jgi:hypothetical protein